MDLSSRTSQKTGAIALSSTTLESLPAKIELPRYDRSHLTPGIVHIGVGNFHRAHLAWYIHRLMQQGAALDWAIIGAGVREQDSLMRKKLLAQATRPCRALLCFACLFALWRIYAKDAHAVFRNIERVAINHTYSPRYIRSNRCCPKENR